MQEEIGIIIFQCATWPPFQATVPGALGEHKPHISVIYSRVEGQHLVDFVLCVVLPSARHTALILRVKGRGADRLSADRRWVELSLTRYSLVRKFL